MDPIIDWLLTGSRQLPGPEELGRVLLERLREAGLPVARVSTALPTQHPEIIALQLSWSDQGIFRERRGYKLIETTRLAGSPIRVVLTEGKGVHRRLDAKTLEEFPGLQELVDRGMTDYLLLPLGYSNGRRGYVSYTTTEPDGFSAETVARLESLCPALSLRFELAAAYDATQSLLEVYLGRRAAERVLSGRFRRGGGERITCALWFCDLRDFTSLTDSRPVEEVLALLDRYFECTAGSVEESGGDVLKFVGDAVLGIFPCEEQGAAACRSAFEAAQAALAKIATFSAEQVAQGHLPVRVGISLHLGEVVFGNIGAAQRLDFTVIGAAVNEAARLEALCKTLGTSLVMSREFVEAAGVPARPFGPQTLKGVSHPVEVFGDPVIGPPG
jgi:adenylate cyclase